jgi:hypothetical protein
MKKGKVFFHPIDGSGPLTISWSSRPKGDATEAKKGSGVGFFSEKGDLLCVIFDDVQSDHDHQILEFDSLRIEVTVKNNLVVHTITQSESPSSSLRKRRKTKKPQV